MIANKQVHNIQKTYSQFLEHDFNEHLRIILSFLMRCVHQVRETNIHNMTCMKHCEFVSFSKIKRNEGTQGEGLSGFLK